MLAASSRASTRKSLTDRPLDYHPVFFADLPCSPIAEFSRTGNHPGPRLRKCRLAGARVPSQGATGQFTHLEQVPRLAVAGRGWAPDSVTDPVTRAKVGRHPRTGDGPALPARRCGALPWSGAGRVPGRCSPVRQRRLGARGPARPRDGSQRPRALRQGCPRGAFRTGSTSPRICTTLGKLDSSSRSTQ